MSMRSAAQKVVALLGVDAADLKTLIKHGFMAGLVIGWAGAAGYAVRTFWAATGFGG